MGIIEYLRRLIKKHEESTEQFSTYKWAEALKEAGLMDDEEEDKCE